MTGLLRRHRNFRLLWAGETTSQVGSSVSGVVLPVVAVTTLHAGAFTVSLLSAVRWLPWLAIGLVVGAWIDQRREQRRLMMICDFVAAAAFATVPLASALGDLTALQLILVALVAGTAGVFFSTAYSVFLLAIVGDRRDRTTGNSALQGSASAANVAGPGLGGLLIDALGATVAVLADSASFLVSAVCLASMRAPREHHRPTCATAPIGERVRAGIHYLRHEPLLRSLTLFGGTSNLALTAYQSILVVFLLRETHLGSVAVGLVLALTGLGGVTGALLARPLTAALGSGRALLATKAAGGACALLIPPAMWITTAMVPFAALWLFAGPLPRLQELPTAI